MARVSVQVVAPVITNYFHCMHCEQVFNQAGIGQKVRREQIEQYPEDVTRNATHLADWVFELAHRYRDQVEIKVIDPLSMQGFLLSLRHRVRSYPTFIVDGRKVSVGSDRDALDRVLQTSFDSHPVGSFEEKLRK